MLTPEQLHIIHTSCKDDDAIATMLQLIAQIEEAGVEQGFCMAQEALRTSEERYRGLIESQFDLIVRVDSQGRFTFVNDVYCKTFGKKPEELLGKTFMPLVHEEDLAATLEAMKDLDIPPYRIYVEQRALTVHGWRWLAWEDYAIKDEQGNTVEIQAIGHDITDRKIAEERLMLVNTAVESTSDAILIANLEHYTIYHNQAFRSLYGYTVEQLNERGGIEALFPSQTTTATKIFDELENNNSWSGETNIQTRDGLLIPTWLRADSVLDVTGKHKGFVVVCTDITIQKQVEYDLIAASESALEASRLKSEFLSNMSHEIRTPLNAIIGLTGLLLETDLNTEQRDFTETIRTSGDTLLMLINDILDFSKIEAGRLDLEYQPFDIRECIEDSLDVVAPQATSKCLELTYTIDASTPLMLIGDVTRLRQVIVNLLSNAVKFTEQGEVVVTISHAQPPLSQQQTRNGLRNGDTSSTTTMLHITVRDTGIGIPTNRLNRLFQSFSQVDSSITRKFGGTGLGLAISKALVEAMGGSISVESEVGKGSHFHFTILAEVAPDQSRTYHQHNQPYLAGKRVLIVDDNETNRLLLTRQVQTWDMKPRASASGTEALEWIKWGEPFDIAILDMHMPEMDGLTLARAIRALRQVEDLPMVLLSSIGGMRVIESQSTEFSAILSKPIKSSYLYNTLLAILSDQYLYDSQPVEQQAVCDLPHAQMRILIAEDHTVNQKVTLHLLHRLGYRADVVANGLEVLDALKRQLYDVVLMDIQMPEMDGVETTSHIRSLFLPEQQPYIIAITAHAMKGAREQYITAGMDDYISKPVRLQELATALRNITPFVSSEPYTLDYVEQSDTSPIDEHIIQDVLNEAEPDDISNFLDIVDIFLETTPDMFRELHDAVITSNPQNMRRVAHTLKGSSQLGATTFANIAAQIQALGDSDTVEGASILIEHLEREYQRVQQAFKDVKQRLSL